MVIINVKEALTLKPKPKVVILGRHASGHNLSNAIVNQHIKGDVDYSDNDDSSEKELILSDLTAQERDIHKQRNKYSNMYHELEIKEADINEFAANYDRIESCTKELQELYNKKQHMEKFGMLPDNRQYNPAESSNIFELKELRRSINNRKSKDVKKLADIIKYPEGSTKRQDILVKIDQFESEQTYLIKKIKELNKYEE